MDFYVEIYSSLTSIVKLMSDRRVSCVLSKEFDATFCSSFVIIDSRNGLYKTETEEHTKVQSKFECEEFFFVDCVSFFHEFCICMNQQCVFIETNSAHMKTYRNLSATRM